MIRVVANKVFLGSLMILRTLIGEVIERNNNFLIIYMGEYKYLLFKRDSEDIIIKYGFYQDKVFTTGNAGG